MMRSLLLLFTVAQYATLTTASSFVSDSCRGTYFESSTPTATLPCSSPNCPNTVTAQPNRIVSWQIVFNSFVTVNGVSTELTAAEKQQHLQCLTDEMTRLGATSIGTAGYFGNDVTCQASYSQLQSIVQTSFIVGVEVKCTAQDCNSCFQYTSEQDCLDDGFCHTRYAPRYDSAENCIESGVFAGCGYWEACISVMTPAVASSDGACWLFSDGCLPDGFTEDRVTCDESVFDTLPKCPPPSTTPLDDSGMSKSPTSSPHDVSNNVLTDSMPDNACGDVSCLTPNTPNGDVTSGAAKANMFGLF